jgi:hypothetical protein
LVKDFAAAVATKSLEATVKLEEEAAARPKRGRLLVPWRLTKAATVAPD